MDVPFDCGRQPLRFVRRTPASRHPGAAGGLEATRSTAAARPLISRSVRSAPASTGGYVLPWSLRSCPFHAQRTRSGAAGGRARRVIAGRTPDVTPAARTCFTRPLSVSSSSNRMGYRRGPRTRAVAAAESLGRDADRLDPVAASGSRSCCWPTAQRRGGYPRVATCHAALRWQALAPGMDRVRSCVAAAGLDALGGAGAAEGRAERTGFERYLA